MGSGTLFTAPGKLTADVSGDALHPGNISIPVNRFKTAHGKKNPSFHLPSGVLNPRQSNRRYRGSHIETLPVLELPLQLPYVITIRSLPRIPMHDTTSPRVVIRRATLADASAILGLVDALAGYEHLSPPDPAAKTRLINDMTGDHPRIEGYLAEVQGVAVGYAFVLETYSSFLALPTLYLEDLFVLPDSRKQKVGLALFTAMVREAHLRGCGRMEWTVLDWNQLAINFYHRLGAQHMKEWQLYRLGRQDMERILDTGC
jgi:GNAT superfamily N-acetyltransferase